MQPPTPPPLPWDALPGFFPDLPDAGHWLPLLRRHASLLEQAQPRVRVTAVSPAEAVRRHYAESLELFTLLRANGEPDLLVDVGSGGGVPGLVIAAVAPGVRLHLIEPLRKRAALLHAIAVELGLDNVTVHALRAEEAGRGALRDAAAVVTARAVAPLRELLEFTAPFARAGGLLALPKGSGLDMELVAAEAACRELDLTFDRVAAMRPEVSAVVRVAFFRKTDATPARYPRRPGMPGRRPL
ncbi:MAG: class I SAM-dependent methyltransferase [Dehalococcoidia bacterium]|nr:class I SAM-dependent methyltransferase [Dehalococcoidia bacterium]